MYIYIRRPRPSPRPGRRLGPPQVWNLSCRTTARAELDKTFRGRAIQTVQTIKPFQTLQTFTLKQLPQQAPQGQGHSNDFLWAFKAAVCQPANAPNPSKIPNTFPNRHPRAKATSPTGTPGPRPQQWLSIGFQSCRLPARKRPQTLQTFQNLQTLQNPPNPPNTVPSRHPRAKATSRTGTPGPRPQQWLSIGFQSCRLPARKRSKPSKPSKLSKTLPSKHSPQQAPQGQGHFPNRHPRAKATAMGFQSYRLPARKRSKPSKTLQTLQTPQNPPNPPNTLQNPPNPPNTLPSRHPRAKATSPTGTPGPRPQHSFLWAFKATVCQPANAPNIPKPSKPSKPSKTLQTLQTPSPAVTPGPRTLQTLQNPPNPPNPPKPSKPSKHPPKPSKPSKHLPQQAPQGQGHFPNRHPRAKATA